MEVAREDSMGGRPVGSMNCRGYADARARHIFRDLTSTGVNVQFHRRTHLPILIASGLLNTPVGIPWWNNLSLTLTP
jgi:hypothetical protein